MSMKRTLVSKSSKKNKQAGPKPTSIIAIEKAYNIELTEYDGEYGVSNYSPGSYKLDKESRVIGVDLMEFRVTTITPLLSISELEHINLTRNQITNLEGIESLKKLKYLYLGGNKISDISPLETLHQLVSLAIWENPIKNLKSLNVLYSLTKIKTLYAQDIDFSNFDFSLLSNTLEELSVTRCNINNLDNLVYAPKLRWLSFSHNSIESIAFCEKYDALKMIEANSNQINRIPKGLAQRFDWLNHSLDASTAARVYSKRDNRHYVMLGDNPLVLPPSSVIELGSETVKEYYDNVEKFGHEPLSEGRIIVIGDGSAGKSSLIERILHNTFEQGKSQTNGVRIDNWELPHEDGRSLTFHLWDFGGQEIQHAVHKFFFTEGCLYVLVLDNKKEEEPEYWLQQIESLGGGAPVLVVFNKHDDNSTEITDRKFLKEKYPNIIGFYNTSCKSGFGIIDFKNDLTNDVIRLRTVNEQFPNNWFAIKKLIAENTSGEQHYINYESFKQVCVNNNADNPKTQKLLLKYLTTIGAVTWFGDTFLNFLHVLSPAWITQGVYKIITSKRTAKLYGKINVSDFGELLCPNNENDYSYDENHYGYILSMMKKFDLCYTADDKNILLPSAFGKEPKVEYGDFKGEGIRTYILSFKDYMPLALMHRYIAKKINDAFDGNYWYSGIVIRDDKSGSLAMIHADKYAIAVS